MTAVGLDSEASFSSRAKEVGMSDGLLTAFTNANLKTYGSLAFVCPYQPGQTDETPLFDAVETLIGRRVTPGEKIPIRRLFFEAHTLALADLKTRFEKDDTSEPSQIPLPERIARLEQQRARLQGVHFSSETEPAHKLVDLVFQMCQDQQVTWVPWEKLISRASEITSSKKEMHITFDTSGSLKLSKKVDTPGTELTGEIKIRQALSRRSRAFDLANLCGYSQMERWHEKLFEILQRPPPNHCSPVSMQQIREADKMLWKKLSEATRGGVIEKPDGTRPVQEQLLLLFNDPEVQYQMLPLPKPASRPGPYDPPKGMVRAKVRTNPSHSHSSCLTVANKTCLMVNRFATHIIRIVAPSQKMASGASEGFMYAGSVSNPNRTRSVHMSDYPIVPRMSLLHLRLQKVQFLSLLRS